MIGSRSPVVGAVIRNAIGNPRFGASRMTGLTEIVWHGSEQGICVAALIRLFKGELLVFVAKNGNFAYNVEAEH